MPRFKDNKGRDWYVRITPYDMLRVRKEADVDLGKIMQDNMRPLGELMNSPVDYCTVLWFLCKPQADDRDVDIQDFMESITGDAFERSLEAFMEGLQEMYPTTMSDRLQIVKTIAKSTEEQQKKLIGDILTELTRTDSRSRWQGLLEWSRGILRAVNLAT